MSQPDTFQPFNDPIALAESDLSITDWSSHESAEFGEYTQGPPNTFVERFVERFDKPIAEAIVCPRCHQHMVYVAYHRPAPNRQYLAFAVCRPCNVAVEF